MKIQESMQSTAATPSGGEQAMTLRELKKAANGWSNQQKKKQVDDYVVHMVDRWAAKVEAKGYNEEDDCDYWGTPLYERIEEFREKDYPRNCDYYFGEMGNWVTKKFKPKDYFMCEVFYSIDFMN